MPTWFTLIACLAASPALCASAQLDARAFFDEAPWVGAGKYRLLVEVDPVNGLERPKDELPADIMLDFRELLNQTEPGAKPDMTTVQVVRHNPETGAPLPSSGYAYGRNPHERPFRWYDAAIPYQYREVPHPITGSDGELERTVSPRAGYAYNAVGDWVSGHLSWMHTQEGPKASYYFVYFDTMPEGDPPPQAPPRGWVGDGTPRFTKEGGSTTASGHTRIAIADWNGDGLADIVWGEQYGQLGVLINRGTASNPEYPHAALLMDAQHMPIDTGMHAAPLVVDWDGDGVEDLLVGTYVNRLVFFKNTGSNADRKLEYQGYVRDANGDPFELPVKPVAIRSEEIFDHDYYPVTQAVDWNSDGAMDLIAGGYVTGRVYYYENIAEPGQRPKLALRGPIEADGSPIQVRDWCAAPCVADFNGDGLLDLIAGGLPLTDETRQLRSYLHYYVNVGEEGAPKLTEKPFPMNEDTLQLSLATPKALDFNADGLLDLAVSAGEHIYLYPNIGAEDAPMFDTSRPAIPAKWGNKRLPVGHQFIDWNGDGLPDAVSGMNVNLNSGKGNPYFFDERVRVLPPDQRISHPYEVGQSGQGDPWVWTRLYDFDQDGRIDILFGDWAGYVWFHRNLGGDPANFDTEGVRFVHADGTPIQVGPIVDEPETGFRALQGARTTFAMADFNGDGLNDLVVGDTYGKVHYFENIGSSGDPQFAEAELLGNLGNRCMVDAARWDNDNRIDVIAGASHGAVRVFLNEGNEDRATFAEGFDPGLPPIKQPRVVMVDLNGDGDDDLFIPGTQGSSWVERSFLRHGYAKARVLGLNINRSE